MKPQLWNNFSEQLLYKSTIAIHISQVWMKQRNPIRSYSRWSKLDDKKENLSSHWFKQRSTWILISNEKEKILMVDNKSPLCWSFRGLSRELHKSTRMITTQAIGIMIIAMRYLIEAISKHTQVLSKFKHNKILWVSSKWESWVNGKGSFQNYTWNNYIKPCAYYEDFIFKERYKNASIIDQWNDNEICSSE